MLKRSFFRVFNVVLAAFAAQSAFVGVVQAQEAPDALIKRVSKEVLDRLNKDPEIQAGNMKKLSDFVDIGIMPHVNFQKMTALTVGRNWRSASPEQQKQLMTEFRMVLLRTYSTAFASAKDKTVRIKPVRMAADDTDVVVNSEILAKRGDPIPVGYRLEKVAEGWKIYDVSVLGSSLVDTYRNQFAQEINAKGIDGLIKSLAEKNKAAQAS
jgi:phospholipid transport system substrate-binding protein